MPRITATPPVSDGIRGESEVVRPHALPVRRLTRLEAVAVEERFRELGALHLRTGESCRTQGRPREVGPSQVRTGEVTRLNVGLSEHRPAEAGSAKTGKDVRLR